MKTSLAAIALLTAGSIGLVGSVGKAIAQPQEASDLVLRRVWAGRGADPLGQPSPDGRQLTYMDWSTGNLALRDMTTGETRHLTHKETTDPGYGEFSIVSPDGRHVAYHWYPGAWEFELRIVDLDGSNDRLLIPADECEYCPPRDWSPDGSEILVDISHDNNESVLALVAVEDGSVRELMGFGGRRLGHPRFSPDGRHIVFDATLDPAGGKRDIFLLNLESGAESRLIESPADDWVLGWAPDSDYVLFASDRTGTLGAWIVRVVDGERAGEPQLVKADLWNAFPMGFTADGAFYYGMRVSTQGVYQATIDPQTGRLLTDPTPLDPRLLGSSLRPRWSPDGRFLSYLTRNGSPISDVMNIRSLETGETRRLTPRLLDIGTGRWSPDGRHLLVLARDEEGRRGLFSINVQTSATETLRMFDDGGRSFWAEWDPDGRTVYFRADYGKESRLVALDTETGAETILRSVEQPTWMVMIWVDVSPDGEHLAFWEMNFDETRARLLTIPTGEAGENVAVHEALAIDYEGTRYPQVGGVRWTLDGQYLMYGVPEEDGKSGRAWRVPAFGGEPEPTELVLEGARRFPDIHPDGRQIAFEAGESEWEIWVMENYLPSDDVE